MFTTSTITIPTARKLVNSDVEMRYYRPGSMLGSVPCSFDYFWNTLQAFATLELRTWADGDQVIYVRIS